MAATATTPLTGDAIAHLHRRAIDTGREITLLLQRVADGAVTLNNGVDRKNRPRSASIVSVTPEAVLVEADHIDPSGGGQLYFNFELDGTRYFFASHALNGAEPPRFRIESPRAIYESERRDNVRLRGDEDLASPKWVELLLPDRVLRAHVRDVSYDGLGVQIGGMREPLVLSEFPIRYLDGDQAGRSAFARVCHHESDGAGSCLGLAVTSVAPGPLLPVESRASILNDTGTLEGIWRRISFAGSAATIVPYRLGRRFGLRPNKSPVRVVDYENELGEPMRAIVDTVGNPEQAPLVVIPPAWGRTKETLLPLAETLCRCFQAAGRSLSVVRFDGTHRRGESWIDPDLRERGREYLRFKFSRAVRDIHATLRFFRDSDEFQASEAVIATFSLAAIEGRRAIATDPTGLVKGWVAVVGMVDLQSGLRSVSGGVDYAYGLRKGVGFGLHELVGVVADMDLTGQDALDQHLVFLEDARRDMERINVPVTWVHGRHDAWMELDRVRQLMSAGPTEHRKLLELPTGHQLRTSREALETFQLVTLEASSMLPGPRVRPLAPRASHLERRGHSERARLPVEDVDIRGFWADYLLGRDRKVGIELLTATSAYRGLMMRQVELLSLQDGETVLDLGSGTGSFPFCLRDDCDQRCIRIVEFDYVTEALRRAQDRLCDGPSQVQPVFAAVDLDLGKERSLALRDASVDSVLASLFLSYLKRPSNLLSEARRVLRPGGRIVLSCLKRDADISRIYVDGVKEVLSADHSALFGLAEDSYADVQRRFLNDAARILDFEEMGLFRFYEGAELSALLRKAGFSGVKVERALGTPPQAIIVSATRR